MPIHQPLTIGTLRDDHLALMREWRELGDDGERVQRAQAIRQAVAEAGEAIEAPSERDEAQGIVDYWASAIAALQGQTYPELLSLAGYVGTQAQSTGKSVCETYEALQPREAQRMARSILEDLFVLGDHGVERDRPRSRQALRKTAGADDAAMFDRVLTSLVESGAIVCRPSEVRDDDCFEAVDGRIAESWPALREWLGKAKTYNFERDRLMEQAQQWSAHGKDPSHLLLNAGAVDGALNFRGHDDLLDEYIDASHRSRVKWRRVVQMLSFVGIIVLGGALTYYVLLLKQTNADLADAQRRAKKAEALWQQAGEYNEQARVNAEIAQRPNVLDAIEGGLSPETAAASGAALERLPILSGAMWLGSDRTPQVSDVRGGRATSFGAAEAGTLYRARAPIYLRIAMPQSEEEYASPDEKAVVPAGAQIVLLDKPRGFERATGVQYWARVRIVPQVYVQYNNASRAEVDRVRQRLADAGFEVPPAERRSDYRNRAEVRFLRPEDKPIAALLQQTVNAIPFIADTGEASCQSLAGSRFVGSNFKLEFWFDGDKARSTGPVAPCP